MCFNENEVKTMNMSYVKFENTYKSLQDCFENWGSDFRDNPISDREKEYQKKLYRLCETIVEECDVEEKNYENTRDS
jgi:NH3-dependent NAD+ synthetase